MNIGHAILIFLSLSAFVCFFFGIYFNEYVRRHLFSVYTCTRLCGMMESIALIVFVFYLWIFSTASSHIASTSWCIWFQCLRGHIWVAWWAASSNRFYRCLFLINLWLVGCTAQRAYLKSLRGLLWVALYAASSNCLMSLHLTRHPMSCSLYVRKRQLEELI